MLATLGKRSGRRLSTGCLSEIGMLAMRVPDFGR
jgi:hypothetical protein